MDAKALSIKQRGTVKLQSNREPPSFGVLERTFAELASSRIHRALDRSFAGSLDRRASATLHRVQLTFAITFPTSAFLFRVDRRCDNRSCFRGPDQRAADLPFGQRVFYEPLWLLAGSACSASREFRRLAAFLEYRSRHASAGKYCFRSERCCAD